MIRGSLISWRKSTELLIQLLDVQDEEKRDTIIEQIEKLLGERETLQSAIQAPFTDEELVFGQKLLPLEKRLVEKLGLYTKIIRLDIQEQQKKPLSFVSPEYLI